MNLLANYLPDEDVSPFFLNSFLSCSDLTLILYRTLLILHFTPTFPTTFLPFTLATPLFVPAVSLR